MNDVREHKSNIAPYPSLLLWEKKVHICDICMYYTVNVAIGMNFVGLIGDKDDCVKCKLKGKKY